MPPRPESDADAQSGAPPKRFPVVGVGASAGGLEAFSQLLRNLAPDTGMAFVLVQHLAAKHESVLPSILARETRMPVREAEEGMAVEPNHVYVIPPAYDTVIRDGHLALQPRSTTEGRHLPVDLFLRTLADVQGTQSVAVILSGTGSDGTLGCKAVKAAGGIAFAQEPGSARYDGMPRSAISAGCVDLVLRPEEIAREIARLSGHEYLRALPEEEPPPPEEEEKDPFHRVLTLLRDATQTDFRCYKKPTLQRRIRRRMTLLKLDRLGDYARWLEGHPDEVDNLHQDLLINVTTFFRDRTSFDALAQDLFPEILKDRSAEMPARLWVPGCATGEEAYSIAICLLETVARAGSVPSIQIFGTDLSATAIEKARAGVYLENIVADVSPERLERFFVKTDGRYQVSKAVRDLCVFAQHDILRDPPFSRLDLVSCRNVLIYLEAPHQKRVLASFHYALRPKGFLMLGPSETIGSSELFEVRDKAHRVYLKKPSLGLPMLTFGGYPGAIVKPPVVSDEVGGRLHLQREADRFLLGRYGPPGVLVDGNFDILHFRGDTSPYLQHPQGDASLNLLRMLRKASLVPVRQALQEAQTTDRSARRELRLARRRGGSPPVTVEAVPLRGPADGRGRSFLVIFEEAAGATTRIEPVPPVLSDSAKDGRLVELEHELSTTKHYQQALLEEQEAANEELQSAHEEVLSSNEELQSINEELETAKEELQSTNEELTTVNEELQNRNQELTQTTHDLVNLLASLDTPIVMVGADLRLRRFTPAAARMYNLIPGDLGRPFGDLRGTLKVSNLEPMIREAIDALSVKVQEVADQDGRWYSLRVHPYKTKDNRIDGAVLLLVDIDEMKRGTERLEQARAYADSIVDGVGHPLLILDTNLRVERGNRAFYDLFQTTPSAADGRPFYELGRRQWDVPELRRRLESLPVRGEAMTEFTVEADFPPLGRRSMVVNARLLSIGETEPPTRILLSIDDRTEEVLAAQARENLLTKEETAARQAENASRLKDEFIATVSHELRGPLNAMAGWVHVLGSGPLEPATVSRGMAAIERAVKAQTRLIEDLLDMSRIMSGKLRLAHRFIDLGEVTRAAMETAGPAAEAKSIQVALRSDNEPLLVLGDPDRLQQVVWNLLSNAVKFTPRDGRVDVELMRKGTSTQLRITDSGQGISPDFLPYIFEPFRQADSSPARSHQGLGLGLAIARHLVESHGGIIRAESAGVGHGTSITILLPVPPLAADLAPAAEHVEDAPPRLVPDRTLLEGVRVMVVEDETDSRDIIAAVLREWGADVLTASSAPEALETLRFHQPHVLVSDIGMPGMDGYELIRDLRRRGVGEGGGVPAIALTAYTGPENRRDALGAGFQEHVAKPADPQELLAAVTRLAGRGTPASP